jgi:hypothetical protein
MINASEVSEEFLCADFIRHIKRDHASICAKFCLGSLQFVGRPPGKDHMCALSFGCFCRR